LDNPRRAGSERLSVKRLLEELEELDEFEAKAGKIEDESEPLRSRAEEAWDARLRRMQEPSSTIAPRVH
jgi:LPS O-antigen subunit length determinant protein (WzzB/FepE family)